ncbi:hypothetical protein GCM10027203_32190 [Nonomuraea fastidiosa]
MFQTGMSGPVTRADIAPTAVSEIAHEPRPRPHARPCDTRHTISASQHVRAHAINAALAYTHAHDQRSPRAYAHAAGAAPHGGKIGSVQAGGAVSPS